ncbi:MAG: glycosyl hydrolase 115 family protein [Prevotella sp.]|nr:glycosyl hydrolase 115 family protein [Prevotella sp.]
MNKLLVSLLLSLLSTTVSAQVFEWHSTNRPATYSVTKHADAVVQTAIGLWKADLKQVTGAEPTAARSGNIRIVQLDREPSATKLLRQQGVPVDSLVGRNDGFFIKVADGQLLVVGNNKRGTAYGILELSRRAGVSPWVWWSNVTPKRKSALILPTDYETLQVASVEYRGIFINDEDWTLQPWSWQYYEAGAPTGRMGAKTYRRVFELLMRLRANAIWPGMHGMTTPFYMVSGAKEQADSCGIVIGTSHCEPLGRNNVGEWNVEERGRYNYVTNGEEVRRYWTERLQEARGTDNIYTIGMRGVHDGPMEGVKTRKEQTEWLQRVIDDQRELLKKYTDKNVERIPQQFVPYKEVLGIMENGLQVPDDVMLTWCDDNYGYMTRLSDAEQQQRRGGGGVYYHLSYWGRPIDYMWLCCTQPGLIYNEMMEAWRHNVRRLWIVNVHELKVAAYPLELFLDMAWNVDKISPNPTLRGKGAVTLDEHLEQWLYREFGVKAGRQLAPAMQEYYRLTAVRRPEFMGWNQVELDKKVYPRGWSPVGDTEFSFSEFGDEADRYLDDWERVCQQITTAEPLVAQDRRDAYFSHVKYQVLGAAAMSQKMLEAQRARSIAKADYDAARWQREDALMAACARSMGAYQDIRELTRQWNEEMAGGQWRSTMCDHPRDLLMFYAPQLPVAPTDQETARYRLQPRPAAMPLSQSADSYVAHNAADYQQAGQGATVVQMLGHSMRAVSLPKGEALTYQFTTEQEGEATLYTAMIPTQPNDKGDLRYSVSIDGGEPAIISLKEKFRSEFWKLSVLRGQALKQTPVTLSKGSHTLTIRALDDHIIVDQWMLDFQTDRKFYVIPTAK